MHGFRQFGRVRGDGELRCSSARAALDAQPGVKRNHAIVIRPQGIDVKLRQFGQIGQHLGKRNQHVGDGIELGGRTVAIPSQQLGHPCSRDEFARQHPVQRRQRDRAVGQHLDGDAALAE